MFASLLADLEDYLPSVLVDGVSLIALNVNDDLIVGLLIVSIQWNGQERPAKSVDVIGGGSVHMSRW